MAARAAFRAAIIDSMKQFITRQQQPHPLRPFNQSGLQSAQDGAQTEQMLHENTEISVDPWIYLFFYYIIQRLLEDEMHRIPPVNIHIFQFKFLHESYSC